MNSRLSGPSHWRPLGNECADTFLGIRSIRFSTITFSMHRHSASAIGRSAWAIEGALSQAARQRIDFEATCAPVVDSPARRLAGATRLTRPIPGLRAPRMTSARQQHFHGMLCGQTLRDSATIGVEQNSPISSRASRNSPLPRRPRGRSSRPADIRRRSRCPDLGDNTGHLVIDDREHERRALLHERLKKAFRHQARRDAR